MEALKQALEETHWLNDIEVVTAKDMRDFLDQRPMTKCESEVCDELRQKVEKGE